MKFNTDDLDQEAWHSRALAEATLIHSKPKTARGRSLEEILDVTKYGHAAERFLIENFDFKDDDRPFKDLYDPKGREIEVKVTEGAYYVPYVLERCTKAKMTKWRKYPDIVYVWIGDRNTKEYTLHNIYEWNGESFCSCLHKSKTSV